MTACGNRREALFHDDRDGQGFLRLVAELPERFGLERHAFVLLGNHYHLLVRTPEPSLGPGGRDAVMYVAEVVWRIDGLTD